MSLTGGRGSIELDECISQYSRYHERNPKLFPGYSLKMGVADVVELVSATKPLRLLDYGCGKGYQYLGPRRTHEQWGGLLPHCYDPGVSQLSERPTGLFDGVICTDVMEHIPQASVDMVLDDIFSFVAPGHNKFVYMTISCRHSRKTLPDGTPMHLTVRPPEWWDEKIKRFERDGLIIRVKYEQKNMDRRLGASSEDRPV